MIDLGAQREDFNGMSGVGKKQGIKQKLKFYFMLLIIPQELVKYFQ